VVCNNFLHSGERIVTISHAVEKYSVVGSFNPYETYQSNWFISPGRGGNIFFLKPPPSIDLLLMEEILHQLIGSLSCYLQGFVHPRWCRISSINSSTVFSISSSPHRVKAGRWNRRNDSIGNAECFPSFRMGSYEGNLLPYVFFSKNLATLIDVLPTSWYFIVEYSIVLVLEIECILKIARWFDIIWL